VYRERFWRAQKTKKVASNKEEKVTKCMASLKEKHTDQYTPMQYRIWSELIVNGAHESLECSMFKRACRNDGSRHKEKSLSVSEVITHIAQAFSPPTNSTVSHPGIQLI